MTVLALESGMHRLGNSKQTVVYLCFRFLAFHSEQNLNYINYVQLYVQDLKLLMDVDKRKYYFPIVVGHNYQSISLQISAATWLIKNMFNVSSGLYRNAADW